MSVLGEALIAAFDSNVDLVWTTHGSSQVLARFAVAGNDVETTFIETSADAWRVSFEVKTEESPSESIHASIRIFSGVFQAVREFLEVRQPQFLTFSSKEEALGRLYEEYLGRQDTLLHHLGYKMIPPLRSSPLVEFTMEKTSPSDWKDRR